MHHHHHHHFPKNPRAMYFSTQSSSTHPRDIIAYLNTARATRFISSNVNRKTAATFYESHKKAVLGCLIGLLCFVLLCMVVKICGGFLMGDKIQSVTTSTTLEDEIIIARGYRWDGNNTGP